MCDCLKCGNELTFVEAQRARHDEPGHGEYYECDKCGATFNEYELRIDREASRGDYLYDLEKEG